MANWGWKQSVIFLIGLAFATSALVAAGLADTPSASPPEVLSAPAAA